MNGRLLEDSAKYTDIRDGATVSMKPQRSAMAPRLVHAMYQKLAKKRNRGVALNGDVVKHQQDRMLKEVNALLPDAEKINLKFSKGRLEGFTKHFNLKFRRVHGEAMSADNNAIRENMPRLLCIVSTYAFDDF